MISKPLTLLLRKGAFCWNPEAEEAFCKLKQLLSQTPILALPDFSKPFILETDACMTGVEEVLMQEGRPIAFLSKALGKKHMGLSTYEKEMLAIIMAVQKWRTYLLGHQFIIKTDHQALKHIMEQKITTHIQQKWLYKLLGFDYIIAYKKGKENLAAGALSRVHEGNVECAAVSSIRPVWKDEIMDSLREDAVAQEILIKLSMGATDEASDF